MARTINRQPFSVSTSSSDYPKQANFTQAEFKGLCDNKNDILIDQQTFADVNNVYVNEANTLVSRPPFKLCDEAFIVKEWNFNTYILRLQKLVRTIEGVTYNVYTLRCASHITAEDDDKLPYYTWAIPIALVENTFVPKVNCTQIEDKVFIWFAGIDFLVFNTAGEKPYFEDATKYLYLPIHKQTVNGIETELETKNFLTDAHKKRYHYSAIGDVDFNALIDKDINVYFSGAAENTSEHLYDIMVVPEQEKTLIYPVSHVGENYYFDMVQTPRANVIMRYNIVSQTIEVSFDGKYFKALPVLANILGEPLITKDGFYIVAFTTTGVAQCKIVTDESENNEDLFVWVVYPYGRRGTIISSTTSIPRGYFETIDTFAYIVNNSLYAECPKGDTILYNEASLTQAVGKSFTDSDIRLKLLYSTNMGLVHKNHEGKVGMIVVALGDISTDKAFGIQLVLVENGDVLGISNTSIISNRVWSVAKPYDISDLNIVPISHTQENDFTTIRGYDIHIIMKGILDSSILLCYPHDTAYNDNDNKYYADWSTAKTIDTSSNKYILAERNDYALLDTQVVAVDSSNIIPIPDINNTDDKLTLGMGMHIELQGLEYRVFGLTDDAKSLRQGVLRSGDLVVAVKDGVTVDDFLSSSPHSNRFYLEKLEDNNGTLTVIEGYVRSGDLVRLRAYDEEVKYAGTTVEPWTYPEAPYLWTEGDAWPNEFVEQGMPQPYGWKQGDALPTGPVIITDTLKIIKHVDILAINDEGIWLVINGMLYTSQMQNNTQLYLDELIDAYISGGNRYVNVKDLVPDHSATLGEYYFAFNGADNKNSLQVTMTRRDVDDLYDDNNTDFLLYLPKRNEQKFAGKITAIHPLSDTQIGVFTNDAVWYVSKVVLDDATIAYTMATKSKIPVGCRDGDTIITALDGQALLFPTQRGITVMAPQDFVATMEKSLSYLSDTIQETYFNFYNNYVNHVNYNIRPTIKSTIYKYWVMFYRFMDKQILLLDTRNSCWWKLSTPYPIKDVTVSTRLYLTLQVDFNRGQSLDGVSYLFADLEGDTITYTDDIIERALNGDYKEVYENEFIGTRKIVLYAEPIIPWSVTSQKLHFYKPDNYKGIKGINLSLQGTQSNKFKLLTKVYRDMYHPTKDDTIEVNVEEIKTLVYRLNLMHAAFFQYTLENDVENELPHNLCLNSLTIKYEVKEKIR